VDVNGCQCKCDDGQHACEDSAQAHHVTPFLPLSHTPLVRGSAEPAVLTAPAARLPQPVARAAPQVAPTQLELQAPGNRAPSLAVQAPHHSPGHPRCRQTHHVGGRAGLWLILLLSMLILTTSIDVAVAAASGTAERTPRSSMHARVRD